MREKFNKLQPAFTLERKFGIRQGQAHEAAGSRAVAGQSAPFCWERNAASGTGTTNRSSTLEPQNTGTALTQLRSHTTNFGPHRLYCAPSPATPSATRRPLQPANNLLRTHSPCPLAQDLCESARPLCQLPSTRQPCPSRLAFLALRTCPCFTPAMGPYFRPGICPTPCGSTPGPCIFYCIYPISAPPALPASSPPHYRR
jgi:hypothetical protein